MSRKGFPVVSELGPLLERLERRERELVRQLAEVERRLREFEDRERVAYEAWVRVEFGPRLAELEEMIERARVQRLVAQRINELVDRFGYHPREALFLVNQGMDGGSVSEAEAAAEAEAEAEAESVGFAGADAGAAGSQGARQWDADEIEARRQAKRESKRAERREKKKAEKAESKSESEPGGGIRRKAVLLYRALARRLHPDSPQVLKDERVSSLWLEAQSAYEALDLDRLLALSVWLGADESGGEGELTADGRRKAPVRSLSERYERLRRLERSHAKMSRKLEESRRHPAWAFGTPEGESRKKLRKIAQREVEADLARAQELLDALEEFIDSIGPPRPPRERDTKRRR